MDPMTWMMIARLGMEALQGQPGPPSQGPLAAGPIQAAPPPNSAMAAIQAPPQGNIYGPQEDVAGDMAAAEAAAKAAGGIGDPTSDAMRLQDFMPLAGGVAGLAAPQQGTPRPGPMGQPFSMPNSVVGLKEFLSQATRSAYPGY